MLIYKYTGTTEYANFLIQSSKLQININFEDQSQKFVLLSDNTIFLKRRITLFFIIVKVETYSSLNDYNI